MWKLERGIYTGHSKKIGNALFGEKDGWEKANGVYVHTPSGSAAEESLKEYEGIYVINDYTEE